MAYLFVQGLGQTANSWDKTIEAMEAPGPVFRPELFSLLEGRECTYQDLYRAFEQFCTKCSGPFDLCGLSLGAVLALHYAAEHPERVHSLVLIAPQVKMPKGLLKLQDVLFRFMPERKFSEIGITKDNFRMLTNSMGDLDLTERLERITCPVLVICGEKDRANRKTAEQLARTLKQAELRLIPHTGHEVNTEAEELAKALSLFYRTEQEKTEAGDYEI